MIERLPENSLGTRDGASGPVIELAPADVVEHSSLRAYWDILSKRRWEILITVLAVEIVVALYSFKMRPAYRSTARVEIEAEAPQIQSVNEFYQNIPTDESFLKTQVQVLESDSLARQTIQQLGLGTKPEFNPHPAAVHGSEGEVGEDEGALVRVFRDHLTVALAPNSRMVEVSFESVDPEVAARVANTLVNDYVEYNFHLQYDATRQASGWMEQQLDELKAKVEKSQQALVDYERRNAIVNVSDKQSVTEERLEDLSKDLTTAENDLAEKQSLYELAQSNPRQVAFIAEDELLQKLEEKRADLKTQYVEALAQYGPNFPKVTRLAGEVKEVQSIIDREQERTLERIGSNYQAAADRERLLAASVARQKAEVGALSQLLIQHNILKRDFDTNQQLYESLLQRLKDATVSAGLRATNIHIVDRALAPTLPVRPKKILNLAIGLTVGLLLGITLAFVQEGLDYSVKTAEDVEHLIGAPSLAIIPSAASIRPRVYGLWKGSKDGGHRRLDLVALQEPGSGLAEAYRILRTSILFSTAPRPPQMLLVTSSQPNEGKTSTSLNLGLTLAQRGGRVLIIDADLRKPGIAAALGLADDRGLSGVLTGACSLRQALQPVEGAPNLWVLPAGPRPPNPAELLSSPSMEQLLEELRSEFEHLVLDSPPLLMVTDATILSTLVDGVILIVEGNVTARGALVRAHRGLRIAGARVLGVVMNKVNFRQDGYHYGPYYYRYPYASNGNGRGHAREGLGNTPPPAALAGPSPAAKHPAAPPA